MKKKEMKKLLPAIVAVVLVLGAGLALAHNGNTQGVPSAKCAASVQGIDYIPNATVNQWEDVPGFYTIIKTSNKADLIISVTAECALATNVTIKGTGGKETSTSDAQLEIRVLVDGDEVNPATPGNVTFARRLMVLKGLLYSGSQVEGTDLPEQYISIYEKTKTANGFNFVMKNVLSGDHNVTVQARAKQEQTGNPKSPVGITPVIGKRTLVVEAVRMVND